MSVAPGRADRYLDRLTRMHVSNLLLMFVVFIEGFASLGVEVIALRRLVPHVGSSITVTAPTIGLFLAALAMGYWSGGRVKDCFLERVLRNFLFAAFLAGVGLSGVVVQAIFAGIGQPVVSYLVFMACVVCPPAWLLAQTVPLLTNLIDHERAGAASGAALTASTAGSVLGASVLSLVVMQLLGVSAAVLLCCATLCVGVAIGARPPRRWAPVANATLLLAVLAWFNLVPKFNTLETAYADYRTVTVGSGGLPPTYRAPGRVFMVNEQRASMLDAGVPARRAPYIERMHRMIVDELQLKGKQVLVLGAGGFTLSAGDTTNHYTYVDIDPNIRAVAERDFLKDPINGDFIVDDARRFVAQTDRHFDAIVVDVYSSHASIPGHLVTAEFWRALSRALTSEGMVMINLVLDNKLRAPFARGVLATIEQGLGRCAVEVLDRSQPIGNVAVFCQPHATPLSVVSIYTDERNSVDRDRGMSGF